MGRWDEVESRLAPGYREHDEPWTILGGHRKPDAADELVIGGQDIHGP